MASGYHRHGPIVKKKIIDIDTIGSNGLGKKTLVVNLNNQVERGKRKSIKIKSAANSPPSKNKVGLFAPQREVIFGRGDEIMGPSPAINVPQPQQELDMEEATEVDTQHNETDYSGEGEALALADLPHETDDMLEHLRKVNYDD